MGYKLAGFDVIGCNEIDPRMNRVYVENHHPKFNYLQPIQEFKLRKDLPAELYNLDILDGSPPCSSFSTAGDRQDGWGVEKHFREGQTKQILDTLFFDFIDLAKELQPKIVIAENVKGLLIGEAKKYVARIYAEFDAAGYTLCHTLLDASTMGVPQARERVFFTAIRKDLLQYIPQHQTLFEALPVIDLKFKEPPITMEGIADFKGRRIDQNSKFYELWSKRQHGDKTLGDVNERLYGKISYFSQGLTYRDEVCPTLTSEQNCRIHYDEPCLMSASEIICVSTFPQDYDFGIEDTMYICGMSVPPVMMAQVASRVYDQWLSKIPK